MSAQFESYWNQINQTLNQNDEIIDLSQLKGHNIIFIVDMVNGFCHQGKMAAVEIQQLIPKIKILVEKGLSQQTKIIAFNDAHNLHSPEFDSYPIHCLEDSAEAELVPELKNPVIKVIKKNSTNGFFAFDFKPNLQWDNIIITGCCTDICVNQLALSCKTFLNQHNKKANIYVAKDLTDTFNSTEHPRTVVNQIAWYTMLKNGIKIVKNFK